MGNLSHSISEEFIFLSIALYGSLISFLVLGRSWVNPLQMTEEETVEANSMPVFVTAGELGLRSSSKKNRLANVS